MDYTQIVYDVDDHIATITLNRPEQLNAFTGTMMHEMIDAFDRIDADDDVRAVIVTGAGRGFCAGADLSGGGETFATRRQRRDRRRGRAARRRRAWSALRIFECTKPVIAAINGAGGRRRRHDDAADGHPPGRTIGQVRLRVRPPRHRARGVLVVVPAARRRHQPGRGVVLHRPGVHRRRGARRRAGAQRAPARRAAAGGASARRARSPTTPRRSPSR